MKERVYNDILTFDIDSNGDNYEAFTHSVDFPRKRANIQELKLLYLRLIELNGLVQR